MSQLLPERRSAGGRDRWEPLGELEQVTERLRRMLDQTFGGIGWPSRIAEPAGWSPLFDVEERDDAYMVEADLPGVKREDVQIELVGNELSITGQLDERERKGVMRRQTRRLGRFELRLTLPEQVDPEQVEATLANGVLTVNVPKTARAERRQIEVKTS
jgi:HSP20 family protein